MANANTNILSINITQSASSTGSNSGNARLNSKYTSSGKGDFNSALNTANNRLNRQDQPAQANPSDAEEIQYTEATAQNPKSPVESKDAQNTASTQGQNQQTQDAPQSLPQNPAAEKNIPAEIPAKVAEDIPANIQTEIPAEIQTNIPAVAENILPNVEIAAAENIPAQIEVVPAENLIEIKTDSATENLQEITAPELPITPIFFASNPETLLPVQQTEKIDASNLMAVMPQSDDNKGQTMLNILSGKTWTAEDVQASISAQNFSTAENPADVLNLQQSAKNFTLSPTQNQNTNSENLPLANLNQFQNVNLNQVQPQNLNPEQQPQIQNQPQIQVQPQNLNVEQSAQVQIQNQAQVQIQPQNLNSVQPQQILNQTQSQQVLEQIQNQMQIQNQIQTEPQTQPVVNSLQPQIQPNQLNQLNQQQSISDLLGANVQVEDNQSAAPLSPIPQMLRQQPEQNQQSPNQNFQQTFSQNLNPEIQTQQQNFGVENTFAQNLTPAVDNVSTPQPVVQTQSAEIAAQAARENENIPAQIVQQARLIRNAENTEMVINLKPEHLGQLTLRVSVSQNGTVNASFFSDNAQVRAAIENSIVQLKQELSDQGLKVDNVQVSAYLNDSGLMNRQGGQAWQQQQQQGNGRRIDFDTLQEEVDAVTPLNENISTDGVDYKV